jgi:dienelactone hydrolase
MGGSSTRVGIGAVPLVAPSGEGPFPAVVLGAEAFGLNPFIRGVQAKLADLGFASVAPDCYHGRGPELERRIDECSVPAELRRCEGASHALSSPWGPMRHDAADAAASPDATAFLGEHR